MNLDPRLLSALTVTLERLKSEGKLVSTQQLSQYYGTFADRFGPEALKALDGTALLETMHSHGNKESLVYWLEFKNDAEFPGITFGSIAGGSALKFGIYRRRETNEWMTGSPQQQRVLTESEAVAIARKHREQLLSGLAAIDSLPKDTGPEDYGLLQQRMEKVAPDIYDLAWAHKYFHLLRPELLDDFHSQIWQRYHLNKLLQEPAQPGRFAYAYWFAKIRDILIVPMNWATQVVSVRNGNPIRYWRVGTSDGTQSRNRWNLMREANAIAIGWPELGDLSAYADNESDLKQLKQFFAKKYPEGNPQANGRHATEIHRFAVRSQDGDLVACCDGQLVLGIARIKGPYEYDGSSDFPHRRPVEWLSLDEWKLPEQEALRSIFRPLDNDQNLREIERRVLDASTTPLASPPKLPPKKAVVRQLEGMAGRIQGVLERKGQVILYGPPGTGKTYWAERVARDLAAIDRHGQLFHELADDAKHSLVYGHNGTAAQVRMCCFHPAYGYEDFLEGYRAVQVNGQMAFSIKPGIFKDVCADALHEPSRKFYLIIDEINRGDIPRIFGELLLLLEKDKRGKSVTLPLSGDSFTVPPNIFVIGTMNTADRSIALLDTALRRRFGFVELMPDATLLGSVAANDIPVGKWLIALNERICEHIGRDARNLQIGHSFFLEGEKPISDFNRFARVIHEDIIPLLEEYCYEDFDVLHRLLGSALVNVESQCVRHELFETGNRDELVAALLAPCSELATTIVDVSVAIEDDGEDKDGDQ